MKERRERVERERTGERERGTVREKGGGCPPRSRTAPPLGALGLAAGQVAALGCAGHRQGGVAPATPKREGEKEGGLLPPSVHAQGAQVGPLVAHGRRHAAGGAQNRGGAGHPKKRGKGEGVWVLG